MADQGQMAVVQVAHGGHKGGGIKLGQNLAQFGDGVNDLHGAVPYQACRVLSGKLPSLTAAT
jgi:hypothetical protein